MLVDPAGHSVRVWHRPGPVRHRSHRCPLQVSPTVSSLRVPVPAPARPQHPPCGFYIIVCPISSHLSLAVQPPLLAEYFPRADISPPRHPLLFESSLSSQALGYRTSGRPNNHTIGGVGFGWAPMNPNHCSAENSPPTTIHRLPSLARWRTHLMASPVLPFNLTRQRSWQLLPSPPSLGIMPSS